MARITFIESAGTSHVIDVPDGTSLMQAAISHNIPGIDADCGGSMTCGTCLVCVSSDWWEKTGLASDHEKQMLTFAGQDPDAVRLSCQIIASPELEGMTVSIPEAQG